MPRGVAHGQVGRVGLATEGDALHLHQADVPQRDQFGVPPDLVRVPPLDDCQTRHRPLTLRLERREGAAEPFPRVREEGTVDLDEAGFGRCVDAHVQLRDGPQILNFLRVLPVRDEERGNVPRVQISEELVDPGVHDWFTHETERAVPHRVGILPSFLLDTGYAPRLLDHLDVLVNGPLDDEVGIVCLPPPLPPDRILVMTPAKDALVGARQRGRRLHAAVGGDAVEGVLVAPSTAAELVLRPAAQLDGRVRPDEFVPLLLELDGLAGRHHLLGLLAFGGGHGGFHGVAHVFQVDNIRFVAGVFAL
mmetsp:Transcript_16459/g.47292  ORF Transcript_16459/g.47292 Transcript_16459/m.47292 type:complete len:306 (-) Transcript_16459:319-1236(-)